MKVLYIEDNVIDRRYFGRIMKKLQVKSYIMADSVKMALSHLSDSIFDIIFLDYVLSDGNAEDILVQVDEKVPIIMVSGSHYYNQRLERTYPQIKAVLNKPFLEQEVRQIVNTLVSKCVASKQNRTANINNNAQNKPKRTAQLFNLTSLYEMSNNDLKFVEEMMEAYTIQSNQLLMKISIGLKENNWKVVGYHAHQIKSVFNIIQAGQLRDWANDLEENCRLMCDENKHHHLKEKNELLFLQLKQCNHLIIQQIA